MSSATLDDVLNLIAATKNIRICGRKNGVDKNRKTRFLLGITIEDQNNLIHSLQKCDYISGPEADYDGSAGSVWKFKKQAFGIMFYIKIKYNPNSVKALSCHIDNIM